MKPGEGRVERRQVRLLVAPSGGAPFVVPFGRFVEQLRAGDVLVLNDAATYPASLGATLETGARVEARLFDFDGRRWRAVLFGAGDWRTRTEDRPAPPRVEAGARLRFGPLVAQVEAVSALSPRLVTLEFDAAPARVWSLLYAEGKPVQYAYRPELEPLWAFQNAYAARPWAAEQPSAGRPLTLEALLEARRRGVEVVALTHSTGLSSTGDAALDAALPLPERYEISPGTAAAVNAAVREGRRVVAVGTSVIRALESAALATGSVPSGPGIAELVLDERHRPRVVTGLLSGIHVPGESHWKLLRSLVSPAALEEASALARGHALVAHELGDETLIWRAPR